MTRPITLESKIDILRDILTDWKKQSGWGDYRYGIPDYKMMISLQCTPQSWSRFRPKLMQYLEYNKITNEEEKNDGIKIETISVSFKYNKKSKEWFGKNNKLLIYRPDESKIYYWHEMTDGEQKKYDVLWTETDYET